MLRHDREAMSYDLLSDTKGPFSGPGYWVLTPLVMPNGTPAFVNRGFVPLDRKNPATRRDGQISGPITVSGLLRMPQRAASGLRPPTILLTISGRNAILSRLRKPTVSSVSHPFSSMPTTSQILVACHKAVRRG